MLSFFINLFFSLFRVCLLPILFSLLCHSLSCSPSLSPSGAAAGLASSTPLPSSISAAAMAVFTPPFAVSATDFGLYAASLRFEDDVDGVCNWKVSLFLANDAVSLGNFHGLLSHARLSAVGSKIFIIDRNAMVRYDTDTWRVVCQAPRRRYGCISTSVEGVFYVIGGGPGLWKRDTGERDKEREGKNKK